jgi:uncharacterized membrane protein (UPF0182 family)
VWLAGAGVLALLVGNALFSAWAEITVKSAWYSSLGMEAAYDTRWHLSLVLGAIGLLIVPVALSPVMWGSARMRRSLPITSRGAMFAVWVVVVLLVGALAARSVAGMRDSWLAYSHAATFDVADPIFDRDVGFFVFELPFLHDVVSVATGLAFAGLLLSAALYAIVRTSGQGVSIVEVPDNPDQLLALRPRGNTKLAVGLLYGYGAALLTLFAAGTWLGRYELVTTGDDLLAGAGKAQTTVALPVTTVAVVVTLSMAVALAALAIPAVRRRTPSLRGVLLATAATWAAIAVVLVVLSTPWWIGLLLPPVALAIAARRRDLHPALDDRAPDGTIAGVVVVTWIFLSVAGAAGATVYDAVLQRGSRLQIERPYIADTLEGTRRASGIDAASTADVEYRPDAVTRDAIATAPASVGSLRFLDAPPTLAACSRLQAFNQFYTCGDVDLDRYVLDGEPRTVFSIGREIDYNRISDFQRRHFTYTHGYGLVIAPVNEIAPDGRPRWLAGGIPQYGLDPELENPDIYFGAQDGMPWAMVNTSQPQFDRRTSAPVDWTGSNSVPVGGNRLAITKFLGGLPYIGGGRRLWNATSGDPAGPESDLLLYRGATERAQELAPFLKWDSDPYFVAAGGHMYVLQNGYAATSRYPYSEHFNGSNYMRNGALMVMDAYSGATKMYVYDDQEPVMRTWMAAFPGLFTPMSELPTELAPHLRYGEDLFDYQSAAIERFHVDDVDTFYNGDEAWAPTEEAYGPGVEGQRIVSPARYTYAVIPGAAEERFIVMRSFKPATRGRGIGFSGWLAVDSDPERFGEMVVLRFDATAQDPLDSLDTFTSNVARDPELSAAIGVRRDTVLRGNTIVVPVGEGLLYVQPLYLDAPGDSLPTLWQVIVSFGGGQVYAGVSFEAALQQALGIEEPGGDGEPQVSTIEELVAVAAREFEAYQTALAAGNDEEAFEHYRSFKDALDRARELAAGQSAGDTPPTTQP